jgi:hypothetical protein
MSFVDTFINAAKQRDANREAESRKLMEGITGMVTGGANAYKWKKRKDLLDAMGNLEDEESRLRSELAMLTGEQDSAGSRRNFDAIMSGLDYNQLPKVYRDGGTI